MEIVDSVALVTGANRGLGKAYCEALLAAGAAKVYAGVRDPSSVAPDDPRLVPVELDVTRSEQVEAAAARCTDATVLINNAGLMMRSPALGRDAERAIRAEMEVNVFGLLRVTQAFAAILAANGGGAIVNVLSVASLIAYPFNATYGASKHAALALTDGIRVQLKCQNTLVVAVFAGFIDTGMAAGIDRPKTSPSQVADATLAGIRLGQFQVEADERAAEAWRSTRVDPAALHVRLQQAWDERPAG